MTHLCIAFSLFQIHEFGGFLDGVNKAFLSQIIAITLLKTLALMNTRLGELFPYDQPYLLSH